MWNWKANTSYTKEPVTLYTNLVGVSFDANGGRFKIDEQTSTASLYSEGEAKEAIKTLVTAENSVVRNLTTPVREGHDFVGWKLEGTDDATASKKVTVYPDKDAAYVAVWEKTVPTGESLTLRTEIYRLDEKGEWVYTEKVRPGEEVKARVFINTEYYAGSGDLVAFYDGDFFELYKDSADLEDKVSSIENNKKYDLVLNNSNTSKLITMLLNIKSIVVNILP